MGGDGTVSEFVNGLVTRVDGLRPPVGFIPLGSGNALVADFLQNQLRHGHETSVYSELKTVADWALERVCGGESCCIDLLEVTTRERRFVAATVCSTGLVAETDLIAKPFRWVGPIRLSGAAVWSLMKY